MRFICLVFIIFLGSGASASNEELEKTLGQFTCVAGAIHGDLYQENVPEKLKNIVLLKTEEGDFKKLQRVIL